MKVSLKAISSSGDSEYLVDFIVDDNGKLSVFCDCPAGEWGRFCKHKWRLLHGDESMLADPAQINDLKKVAGIAQGRNASGLYDDINELELEIKGLSKLLKKEKSLRDNRLSSKNIVSLDEFSEASARLFSIEQQIDYCKYLVSKNKQLIEIKLKEGF
jgi:uncharacterized Zn finger protein